MKKKFDAHKIAYVVFRTMFGVVFFALAIAFVIGAPVWVVALAIILDSPLYSKHGFTEKVIHLIFKGEFLVADRPRDFVMVIREKDIKPDTEEK